MFGIGRAQGRAAPCAVQLVVQTPGQVEEALVAVDHQPPDVHVEIEQIAQQGLEHLSHAPAGRGRVDLPHRRKRAAGRATDLMECLGQHTQALAADQLGQRADRTPVDHDLGWCLHNCVEVPGPPPGKRGPLRTVPRHHVTA
jgi:hypothetical protein